MTGYNTKLVFCHSLSHPGHVLNAFAWQAWCGAQYSCSLWMYSGQTRHHAFYIAPEKIGYVPCLCDGCGKVWVATNIVYHPMVHYGQVPVLDLEKFYPILPSKLLVSLVVLVHCFSYCYCFLFLDDRHPFLFLLSLICVLHRMTIFIKLHVFISDDWFSHTFTQPDSHVLLAHL